MHDAAQTTHLVVDPGLVSTAEDEQRHGVLRGEPDQHLPDRPTASVPAVWTRRADHEDCGLAARLRQPFVGAYGSVPLQEFAAGDDQVDAPAAVLAYIRERNLYAAPT